MSKSLPITAINTDRFDSIQDLKEETVRAMVPSMQKIGVILPLVVVGPNSRTGTYDLLDGRHRLEAAKRAGLTHVPVVVRKTKKADAILTQVVANTQRTTLTELEEGCAYKAMVDKDGMTMTEVAGIIGKTKAYVSQRIALTRTAPEVQSALETEQINFSDARRIGGLAKGDQVAALTDALAVDAEGASQPDEAAPPSKPGKPKAPAKTKAQAKRERSKKVQQSVASRKGQKPGSGTKGKSLQERYEAAKPAIIEAIRGAQAKGLSAAQEKLVSDVLDYLMSEKILLVRAQ